jgi:hypothetical protein
MTIESGILKAGLCPDVPVEITGQPGKATGSGQETGKERTSPFSCTKGRQNMTGCLNGLVFSWCKSCLWSF